MNCHALTVLGPGIEPGLSGAQCWLRTTMLLNPSPVHPIYITSYGAFRVSVISLTNASANAACDLTHV